MASIIVSSGAQEGLFLPLGKRTSVIGRNESVPLQIEDERVSRKHLRIRFDPDTGGYFAKDMGSSNGTFVGGRRITDEEVALSDHDEITIGDTRLLFTLVDPTDKSNAMDVLKKAGERRRSTLMR
jgi:pSer/pThr/pTyr-binding forkhead associated (FHA) protein